SRDDAEVGRRAAGPATRVRFWCGTNERAEAQAVARDIEAALAAGEVKMEDVCVAVPRGGGRSRAIAAALEERRVPYRLTGPGAFFQRPEVRDVIAWLRLLADPTDAAAAVRGAALRRPRPLHDDRPPTQARHGFRSRGLAGEPPDTSGGTRPDPRVPPAPSRGGARDGRDAGRRLRPSPD